MVRDTSHRVFVHRWAFFGSELSPVGRPVYDGTAGRRADTYTVPLSPCYRSTAAFRRTCNTPRTRNRSARSQARRNPVSRRGKTPAVFVGRRPPDAGPPSRAPAWPTSESFACALRLRLRPGPYKSGRLPALVEPSNRPMPVP